MHIAAAASELLAATGPAIRARYDEPWRHYHDWSHPIAMIRHLAAAEADGVPVYDPAAAVGFVLWHDAIYDPQATHGRNEMLSATLCRREMTAQAASVEHAVAAIVATIDHREPSASTCPDGALLLDVDLAILGASDADFARYNTMIAAEYTHVAPDAYRIGRTAVLRRFLARERLYVSDWGFARWEVSARANLARALEAIAG